MVKSARSAAWMAAWIGLVVVVVGCGQRSERAQGAEHGASAVTATGSMAHARTSFPAIALQSGKVLIAGGSTLTVPDASNQCELYDPATGTFQPTGSLQVGRSAHGAALLPDGRVLVAGGYPTGGAPTVIAEIYDPATGAWTSAGSDVSRNYPIVAPLADGRVLVAGGAGSDGIQLASARVFDPTSGTWSAAGPLVLARNAAAAVTLADGRVLIVGGYVIAPGSSNTAAAEIFDPATGTFTAAQSMHFARGFPTATRLPDGRVLVAGGGDHTTELYDPANGTWTVSANLSAPRQRHQAALLADGSVLFLGGYALATVDRWIPGAGVVAADPLPEPRFDFALAKLPGGALLLAGGMDASSSRLSSAIVYSLGPCVPATCASLGRVCGSTPDGCGGTLTCGTCADGLVCSAAGTCGGGDPGAAVYDAALHAPRCLDATAACDSGVLLVGRGPIGPEPHAPNTVGAPPCADGTSGSFHGDESLDRLRISSLDGAALAGGHTARIEATVWAYSSFTSDKLDLYVTADATAAAPAWTLLGTLTPGGAGAQTLSTTFTLPAGAGSRAVRGVFRYSGVAGTCPGGGYTDVDDLVFSTVGPADTAPPTISIASPAAGAVVNGTVTIAVNAADDVGVTQVSCSNGAGIVGSATAAPFSVSWDTRAGANGAYTVTCIASDASGKATTSAPVAVTVRNDAAPPTIAIRTPAPDAVLSGFVLFQVDVSDDVGVVRVDYYLDGVLDFSSTSAPDFGVYWNADVRPVGPHILTATARDAVGNTTTSAPVAVTVSHETNPPTTSLTSPAPGAVVRGLVTLTATATDDVGIFRLEFWDGSTYLGGASAPPYTITWSTTTGVANGAHTLYTRAYDACNNVGTSAPVTVTVANDTTPPTVSLSTPASGAVLTGTATLTASAADDVGVARVEFWDGTAYLGQSTAAPWSYAWNTTAAANGAHTLTARAYDAAGNSGASAAVSVTVSNGSSIPTAVWDATLKAPRCSPGAGCDSGSLLAGRGGLGPEVNAPNTIKSTCADGAYGGFHSDESLDRLKVLTVDGSPLAAGKSVRIEATVWAYSSYAYDKLDLYYTSNASNPVWTYLTTLTPTGSGARTLSATYTLPAGALQAVRGTFRYNGSAAPCTTGGYDDHDDLVFAVQ